MSPTIANGHHRTSDSFLSTIFTHLVERVAPGFFLRHGRILDEEGVAEMEATAALTFLERERKFPPYASSEQASLDAERLFRCRLHWRVKKLAPKWRAVSSFIDLEDVGYEPQDKRTEHQPEHRAVIGDTIRVIERALTADGWSPEDVALYFDYELGELTLQEYAEALGTTKDVAKQRASRTRRKLQERLGYLAESLVASAILRSFLRLLRRLFRLNETQHGTMFRHV
ncbi:MAG: hypothetical protein QM758_03485 [Armatimonas sp.]